VSNVDRQECVFILDGPHYHRVRLGERHVLRGLALAVDGPEVVSVTAHRAGEILLEAPVRLPSPDVGRLLRSPRAASCRFAGELRIDRGAPLQVRARRDGGGEELLFVFDVPWLEQDGPRLARAWRDVLARPAPSPELVERTQGGRDVEAYRDSIVSGALTTDRLLRAAGADPRELRDILDLGCGTGRLLLGQHVIEPWRRLVGVDVEPELVDWAREYLPAVASWRCGTPSPPLDLPPRSFDLIQVVSVFTHLPLGLQRLWLEEIHRLLRPGGWVLVTLHGPIYARLLLDAAQREVFAGAGYLEVAGGPAGSNPFATFHAPAFARELFRGFECAAVFPRGRIGTLAPSLFPIAALQDVYVLRA
jgi:SAM-dependent methyltransferase